MLKKQNVMGLGFFVFSLVFAIVFAAPQSSLPVQSGLEPYEYVPNEVLAKFKPDMIGSLAENKWLILNAIDAVHGKIKSYLKRDIITSDWDPENFSHRSFIGDQYLFHIRLPEYVSVDQAISMLKSIPHVEYVEKNGIARIQNIPNDTYFLSNQWGLYNTDPNNYRKDIHAPEAWDISTGSPNVIIAILDTGIDYNHVDLQANLWTNPNETADGFDNDQNGFVDDLHGWNFVSGNNEIIDNNVWQYNNNTGQFDLTYPYHGTHVSGIIGALGNNETGVSGVCWNVKIMVLKILNEYGQGDWANTANAIDYATNNGAYLSNNSYGSTAFSQTVKNAIARALLKSKLFVAAAGNTQNGTNNDKEPFYPASYEFDNIISVLATYNNDKKCDFSNYGSESVDIGAPGFLIFSTKLGSLYHNLNGTSMAAPHVAGIAGLALGVCPGLSFSQTKSKILSGGDDVSDLHGKCVSGARANAYNVLNSIGGTTLPTAPSNLFAYPTAWNIINLSWNDNSNNELGFEIQRKDQYQATYLHDNCADNNPTSMVTFQDKTIDPTKQRTYTYKVRAANRTGTSAFTNTASASVPYAIPYTPTDLEGPSPVLYPLVHFYWSDIAVNELNYFVERRLSGSGPWSIIATLGSNVSEYSDPSAQGGHSYDYRIRAWNPLGYSAYSNTITIEVINW